MLQKHPEGTGIPPEQLQRLSEEVLAELRRARDQGQNQESGCEVTREQPKYRDVTCRELDVTVCEGQPGALEVSPTDTGDQKGQGWRGQHMALLAAAWEVVTQRGRRAC